MSEIVYIAGAHGMLGRAVLASINQMRPDWRVLTPGRKSLNLLDPESVRQFLKKNDIGLVINCAGRVGGISANVADPVGFLHENTTLNCNLISAAQQAGVRRFLNFGSSCMYPKDYKNPLKEEYILRAPLEPTNEGYALAKIVAAKLCEYITQQYGFHYKTLIPPNLYGPWDNFAGQGSHLIASIIQKIHSVTRSDASSVEIWGDGSARREFLYVADLARFAVDILGRMAEMPGCLNVGAGHDHTIKEYYELTASVMGYEGSFTFDLTKPVGMRRKLIDSTKALALGWKPETSIEEGIRSTYKYFLDHV